MSEASGPAHVESIHAIVEMRAAMLKFAETAGGALAEADSDAQRVIQWLKLDRLPFWNKEIVRRQEAVQAAKAALFRKQLTADESKPSAIEERRAVDRAKAAVEEAIAKLAATRRWISVWDREYALYRGHVQLLHDAVARDVPNAASRLSRMVESLEQYAALSTSDSSTAFQPTGTQTDTGEAASQSGASSDYQPAATVEPADEPVVAEPGANLRRRTPPVAARASIPLNTAASLRTGTQTEPVIAADDLEHLNRLSLAGEAPKPGARVIVELGVLREPLIYLQRVAGVDATSPEPDSGWFIGRALSASAAIGTGATTAAVTVADVLSVAPALRNVLALPEGSLVMIIGDRISSLLDENDRQLWNVEFESPLETIGPVELVVDQLTSPPTDAGSAGEIQLPHRGDNKEPA